MVRIFYVIMLILAQSALAIEAYDPFLAKNCQASKAMKIKNLKSFKANSFNDLTKEYSPYLDDHKKSYIYGRVLDYNCKPVKEVTLKMFIKGFLYDGKILDLSGMRTSNNLGEFIFATYNLDEKQQNISGNILIVHDGYYPFYTDFFVEKKQSFAYKAEKFKSFWLLKDPEKYNQNNIYYFEIVLPYENVKIRY